MGAFCRAAGCTFFSVCQVFGVVNLLVYATASRFSVNLQ